jgi:uncharacterized membrane protein HdeD (DUF308 family)
MPAAMPMNADTLRKYSTWFLFYGILLVILGIGAIAAPGIATLATEIFVGWLLVAVGVFGLIAVFSAGKSASGFWWNLFTSIVYLLAGLSLLYRPVIGTLTLTLILTAYLIAGGISKLVMAFGYRMQIPNAWLWVLLSGIIDLVLGIMILMGLPGTAGWVIGLMVGINLLMMGVAIVACALSCKSMAAQGGR